jgi:hypothetical protein
VKKLACRLGRHEWTTRVEEGESWQVCAARGKGTAPSPSPEQHHPVTREAEAPDHGHVGRKGEDWGGGGAT